MSSTRHDRVSLSSGHVLGYAEYGDPAGKPVVHFHGLPSSRFEAQAGHAIAMGLHARILVVDRPGIGLSDWRTYTIASWPNLIAEFANALQLETFSLLGFSGGGKYVAACAWKIPQRLTAAAIVSGSCPFDLPGARKTLGRKDAILYRLADTASPLLRLLLWKVARDVRTNPATILDLFANAPTADQRVLELPGVQDGVRASVADAFAQGTRGVAWDWRLEARPWGFSLRDVQMPVQVWHGEQDTVQPVEQGRILVRELPQAVPHFIPEEGHLSLLANRYEELLASVVGRT